MPFDHAAPPETSDPRKSLAGKSIHDRCAGARDLSRFGTPDDIPALIILAQEDRSPAVRLGAAGAAADILSRYRTGPRRDQLDEARRRALFDLFKGMDPGVNAGLFSLLACIGIGEGFQRISVGLRDPRGDVRLGAAIGLLRLCESAAAEGDATLEAEVVSLLRDPRLKPDAAAEVAWVAARVGFRSARAAIGALNLGGAPAELRERALDLLQDLEQPLRGAFISDGRDAGEVDPHPARPSGFAVFSDAGTLMGDGEDGAAWAYLDGILPGGLRRMFVRRVGDAEPGPTFQLEGRTWTVADEDQILAGAWAIARPDELDWAQLDPSVASPLERHAAAILDPWLPQEAPGDLARGLLLARAGDPAGARKALTAAAEAKKKVPAEARYFLGRLLHAAGELDAAREHLQAFLSKAKKKDPRREAAEALI